MESIVGKKYSYIGLKIGKVEVISEPRVIKDTSKTGKIKSQKTCKVKCSCGSKHEVSFTMISNGKCKKCPVCNSGVTGSAKRVVSLFEYWMKKWEPETHKPATYKLPFFRGGVGEEYVAGFCYVDKEDYERFSKVMCVKPKKYVNYNYSRDNCSRLGSQYNGFKGNRYTIIHRIVINCTSEATDHINGVTLDNRSYNLREATVQQNNFNKNVSSGKHNKRGLRFDKGKNKPWVAQIQVLRKGYSKAFLTKEEALVYRDCLALHLHGEFAYLNYEDKREYYIKEKDNILTPYHKNLKAE